MEPSDPTRAESYEMEAATPTHPSPTIPPEQATGRTRVRFNSSAAEIPPSPPRRSYSHISEAGSDRSDRDKRIPDVENLMNAHNAEADPDSRYSVTGAAQGGVFYQLLQAYKTPAPQLNYTPSEASTASPARVLGSSSGAATPSRRKWYDVEKGTAVQSQETLATLIGASAKLANPNTKEDPAQTRPAHKRTASGGVLSKVWKSKEDKEAKIKIHVANIIKRQQYIMCRALMLFGAPTHRLEEYLAATAKVLEINSQFLYIPGCMIISFDDALTHTAEVKIVRTAQGVNLGKLKDTHAIYKEVLHDIISLDEALVRLDEVINAKDRHPVWVCVVMYGLASAAVSVFFKARLIDMPVIFVLGCLLGLLQLVVAPMSKTYSTVFEVSATILFSFLARAFGSINDGKLFCFSAIAQSAIAMILPGWVRTTPIRFTTFALLTVPARAMFGPGAPIPRHRPGFHPTGLCHHLLLIPRLRHNRWHCHLRRHRFECDQQHTVRCASELLLELPLRPSLRFLHNLYCTGQVQANASDDLHRNRGLHCQLLRQHEVQFFCSYCSSSSTY
jgi:uncharacterized membrane protein YjjP (DUF1212 family)